MESSRKYILSFVLTLIIAGSSITLFYVKTSYIDNWPIEPSQELIQKAQEELNPDQLEEFYLLGIETNQRAVNRLIEVVNDLIGFFFAVLILFFVKVVIMVNIIKKNNVK